MKVPPLVCSIVLVYAAGALFVVSTDKLFGTPSRHVRKLSGDAVGIEDISIKGSLNSWHLQKICLDGQAYLLSGYDSDSKSISPSYKGGVVEQCLVKPTAMKQNS